MDTSVVAVSNTGMLLAHSKQEKKTQQIARAILGRINQPESSRRTTNVIIQAESGVSATKDVAVEGIRISKSPELDINDFVPDFLIKQKVRIAGTKEWFWGVEAQIGETVEIRMEYQNISENVQSDVMIRVILPSNMEYIPSSTTLYNASHPNGGVINQDDIVMNGINIGCYDPGANAYIRFTAKVVNMELKVGSNTLASWSQCGIDNVTLQDYAVVKVWKK